MIEKLKILTLVVLFVLLGSTFLFLRAFGSPILTEMDDYFLRYGQEETGSNNIVTSIVFDYRALDTLGEASVLFAAASGIYLVFRRRGKDDKE